MEHEPIEDIPHCHHHHHHLQYHTHHHHHGPSHDVPRSMGEQNKSHYKYFPLFLTDRSLIANSCVVKFLPLCFSGHGLLSYATKYQKNFA